MTLNSSGPISIGGATAGQSINLELGRAATATSNLNESALRTLAGVASGAISLSNFYGKSAFTAGSQTFTSSGSFTVPAGYTTLTIEVWGGGGSGGGDTTTAAGNASSVSGTGLTTMTANGGSGGGPRPAGAGGVGGTASGGNNTNTTGNTGQASFPAGGGGSGANGISGSIPGGIGGAGGVSVSNGDVSPGANGTAPSAGGGGSDVTFTNLMDMTQSWASGGGGGSGGYSKTITSSIIGGTVLTVTVGAGGVSDAGDGGDGRVIITYA